MSIRTARNGTNRTRILSDRSTIIFISWSEFTLQLKNRSRHSCSRSSNIPRVTQKLSIRPRVVSIWLPTLTSIETTICQIMHTCCTIQLIDRLTREIFGTRSKILISRPVIGSFKGPNLTELGSFNDSGTKIGLIVLALKRGFAISLTAHLYL